MELITQDGKYFIDKNDYEAMHDLHKKLPEYMKSAELAIRATDFNIEELKSRRNTLAKFRRELGEVFALFRKLTTGGKNEAGK